VAGSLREMPTAPRVLLSDFWFTVWLLHPHEFLRTFRDDCGRVERSYCRTDGGAIELPATMPVSNNPSANLLSAAASQSREHVIDWLRAWGHALSGVRSTRPYRSTTVALDLDYVYSIAFFMSTRDGATTVRTLLVVRRLEQR